MPCGSVGQFGEVNVKPLSVPASTASTCSFEKSLETLEMERLDVFIYCLDGDTVEPLAVFAQVEAVDADEPIG